MQLVTIDGPAGAGKSTVSAAVAKRLGLEVLDTGAMYRAVTVAVLEHGIDPGDGPAVGALAGTLDVVLEEGRVLLDGRDVTAEIRSPEVSAAVSAVAAVPGVRALMVPRQRLWARRHGGGVAEGRDMGTVVFPDATLKVFLVASPAERARRRAAELGVDDVASVEADIVRRDHLDSTREASPLVAADDAVMVDTDGLDVDEVVDRIVTLVGGRHGPERPPAGTVADDEAASEHHRGRTVRLDLGRGWVALGLYRILRSLAYLIARVYWRLDVVGADRIPQHGGFVFAPVHRSNIDFLLPALATPRRIRWMAKHTIFKGGWIDRLLVAVGAFPVDRTRVDRHALNTAESLLAAGEGVVMFPEGRRKEGPVVEDIFDGPAFCASRQRVPIVPMGVAGSDRAMPIGSKMVWPRKVVLVIGEPIYPDVPLAGQVPREKVRVLSAELQGALQDLYDDAKGRLGKQRR